MTERVLYLVVCAASLASRIDTMVKLAHNEDWSVYCLHPFKAAGGAANVPGRHERTPSTTSSCCGWSWRITGRSGDRAGPVTRTVSTSRG
jgi:hypothetical protein